MRPALGWVRQFARRVGVPRLRGSAHGARPVSNSDDPVSASLRRPTDGAVAGEATTASSRKESLDVAASAVSGGPDGSLLLRPGVDLKRQPSRNALFGDKGEACRRRNPAAARRGMKMLGVVGAINPHKGLTPPNCCPCRAYNAAAGPDVPPTCELLVGALVGDLVRAGGRVARAGERALERVPLPHTGAFFLRQLAVRDRRGAVGCDR